MALGLNAMHLAPPVLLGASASQLINPHSHLQSQGQAGASGSGPSSRRGSPAPPQVRDVSMQTQIYCQQCSN